MNYREKIAEKVIEHLVGLVLAFFLSVAVAVWKWMPKTWLTLLDSKIPKTAIWSSLILSLLLNLLALAYLVQTRKRSRDISLKIEGLSKTVKSLEQKNQLLESGKDQLQTVNGELQKQLQAVTNNDNLDSLAEGLLQLISQANSEYVYRDDILSVVSINPTLLDYHLTEMLNLRFIKAEVFEYGIPPAYGLTQKGRKYLKDKGLLNVSTRQ